MKIKGLSLLCFLLTSMVIQANDTIPIGTWVVTQTSIEKYTDGRSKSTVYNSASKVQSYVRCPQVLEVKDSVTLMLRYSDETEETAKYKLEGNQLIVYAPDATQSYQFSMNGEKMTLRITHNYLNNLREGRTERIEEKWSIDLQKK